MWVKERVMPERLTTTRQLGKTGVTVPIIGYGTAPLGKPDVSQEDAERCLNHAIDLGVTYLDTSPDYGSEPKIGPVMRARRDEVFLATKVNKRRKQDVLDELKGSLRRLQTDHVDLIQVHSVSALADLEEALAPDGAVAALEEARRDGLVRFIGITGHARPAVLARGLERYDFDTVLCALGIADHLISGADLFLLPTARQHDTGVIAMKVLGHGSYPDRASAIRYSLGLDGVALAILGMRHESEIDENVRTAQGFRPLGEQETQALVNAVRPLIEKDAEQSEKGHSDLFWLHDTSVMGWRQKDAPAMVAY
jgi:aryl-alcohol dehydrogenase-like predicted oxidoreductase